MNLITRGCFMVGGRVKVTGSLTGTSTLSVPAGVTSITFTGQGGAGVYQNAGMSPSPVSVTSSPMSTPPTPIQASFSANGLTFTTTSGTGYDYITPRNVVRLFRDYLLGGGETLDGGIILGNVIPTSPGTYNTINARGFVYMQRKNSEGTPYAYGFDDSSSGVLSGLTPNPFTINFSQSFTVFAAGYISGTSTTVSSAQSTNGTKTWASHAAAGNPAAYQQTMTLSGAAATISYSVANGTTLSYEYML